MLQLLHQLFCKTCSGPGTNNTPGPLVGNNNSQLSGCITWCSAARSKHGLFFWFSLQDIGNASRWNKQANLFIVVQGPNTDTGELGNLADVC